MKLVLEAIFEPTFLESSHGYRPGKGCHTALNYIKMKYGERKWFIEGDISQCFDSLDHKILIKNLETRIKDQVFMDLIYKALKAGYIDLNHSFNTTDIGTPQGSIISPILCNIYLHHFDKWMKEYTDLFNKGTARRKNPEHYKVTRGLKGSERAKANKALRLKGIPSSMPNDEKYRRLAYVRYADDFLLGVIGSHKDCLKIRMDIREFLESSLNLQLNMEKTVITPASSDRAKFLGYEIHITPIEKRAIEKVLKEIKVVQTSQPLMSAPVSVIVERLSKNGYCRGRRNNPTRKGRLIHNTLSQIVNHFKLLWLGLANYYSMCTNFGALNQVYYILFYSCVLTLASKLRLKTKRKVLKKFGKHLIIRDTSNKIIASFPKWGKPKTKHKSWTEQTHPFNLVDKLSKIT